MAIYNSKENICEYCEIKQSEQIIPTQIKYLIDGETLNQTSNRFGEISKRCVLYREEDTISENP